MAPLRPYLPSPSDREGALLALARLQETYDLPLEDLLGGTVAGEPSLAPLSQRTAVELGTLLLQVLIHAIYYYTVALGSVFIRNEMAKVRSIWVSGPAGSGHSVLLTVGAIGVCVGAVGIRCSWSRSLA